MRDKGTRYKAKETKINKEKIKRAIFKTILTIIVVGIVNVGLFLLLFEYQPEETGKRNIIEPTTVKTINTTKPTQKHTEKLTQATAYKPTEVQMSKTWIFDIDNPDYNYNPKALMLTEDDRELIAKIVMNEFGDGGYEACCLQAQAFRDDMIFHNLSAENAYHYFQYDAYSLDKAPNKNCYDAVDYIFAGNMAIPHRVIYMYDTNYCSSEWHESQNFVIEYKGVRFFDAK